MASLLTAAQKASVNSAMSQLHDTFAREIFIYTEQKEETETSEYNSLYGRNEDGLEGSYNTIVIKESALARVYYPENPKQEGDQFKSQVNISFSQGSVRLKVDEEVLQKLLVCRKVEVDGDLYVLDGNPKVVGPFGTQYYSLFLKREN